MLKEKETTFQIQEINIKEVKFSLKNFSILNHMSFTDFEQIWKKKWNSDRRVAANQAIGKRCDGFQISNRG